MNAEFNLDETEEQRSVDSLDGNYRAGKSRRVTKVKIRIEVTETMRNDRGSINDPDPR